LDHVILNQKKKRKQLVGGCVSCGGVRVPIYNIVLENFISMTINIILNTQHEIPTLISLAHENGWKPMSNTIQNIKFLFSKPTIMGGKE
jgi:hypothetical protein